MGWLSRLFRRRPAEFEYVGRHRPGAWGEIALPPMEAAIDSTPPEPTITTAPAPAVAVPLFMPPEAIDEPAAPPIEAVDDPMPRQRVRLGFIDGSSVDVADGTAELEALTRAMSRIFGD